MTELRVAPTPYQAGDTALVNRGGVPAMVALGGAATLSVGTGAGNVAAGDDSRLSNSREWIASTVDQAEAEAGAATTRRAWTAQRVRQAIAAWWATISLTKSDVGLADVDNTADAAKNVASATRLTTARAIALGGDAAGSALFDGAADVTLTVTIADDSHNHVISNVDGLQTALDGKAALASPAFTGVPTAPTAGTGTNTTQIASTAFVHNYVASLSLGDMPAAIYDPNSDGKVAAADTADSVPWAGVTSKPATFAPAAHTHPAADISDSTAAGRALVTAADAAAQRTALGLAGAVQSVSPTGTPIAVIWTGSQAEYDAIGTPDPATLYIVV